LFCGAGGCSVGYARAGFEVVGVDHRPMPRYPFVFHQADALDFAAKHGREFDAIHASPPCQKFSQTRTIHRGRRSEKKHPDLIDPTRQRLEKSGRPWVMENVPGAPLEQSIVLCGSYFGLRVKRHRLFESNVWLMAPGRECYHPPRGSFVQAGRKIEEGDWVIVAGHISGVRLAGKAMGIDWMTRDELVQAIPPAYTEWIGRQLIASIR
jgi:DNA (cytosine-5)-methyltransferase 1